MKLNELELLAYQTEYQNKAYFYIGKMIGTFNELEKSIERYIIAHFDTKEGDEFQAIILDRLTMQSKKEAFCTLLNNISAKNGFIKTGKNSWPDGKLFKAIDRAQKERNYFAHYNLFNPMSPTPVIVALAEFRDNLNLKTYNIKQYDDLLNLIIEATKSIKVKTDLLISERLR